MKNSIAISAALVLLCCATTVVMAAEPGEWVTCRDGLKMHSGGACDSHGGVVMEPSKTIPVKTVAVKTVPIDTTKGLSPKKSTTTTTTKNKTNKTAASKTSQPKVASNTTRNPTAKCMDGAMYFSRERKGACAKHGGLDKWYGW